MVDITSITHLFEYCAGHPSLLWAVAVVGKQQVGCSVILSSLFADYARAGRPRWGGCWDGWCGGYSSSARHQLQAHVPW